MTPRKITVVCGCALLFAGAAAAQNAELERVAEAIEIIKLQYVDPVDDGKLVAGCQEGIKLHAGAYPGLFESGKARATITKSAVAQISDTLASAKPQTPDDNKMLVNACLSGMLKSLDKQSRFLDKEEMRDLRVGNTQSGGIGLELAIEAGLPIIVTPVEGTPAQRVGLKSRDFIINIDSVPTKGVSLSEIVKRLRGPTGSTIALTVQREGVSEPLEFSLPREHIRIQSVKWKSVAPGYVYIRISQFQEATVASLAQAIAASYLENQRDIKGLILDLRTNPGGLLNACIGVSAAFLPLQTLVTYTVGRAEDNRMQLTTAPENYIRGRDVDPLKYLPPSIKTIPMVVLVNHASAACPEIVAAALQDHKRAKILGVQTFGHGTIATILPLRDKTALTALKLTTSRFFRPNGGAIAEIGVTPDTVLEENTLTSEKFGTMEDTQLIQAVKQLGGQPAL